MRGCWYIRDPGLGGGSRDGEGNPGGPVSPLLPFGGPPNFTKRKKRCA